MKYGLIGLGNLGNNIAVNLIKSGFQLYLNDIDLSKFSSFETLGAIWCDTPSELAKKVDCVITCLPSPKTSTDVMMVKMERWQVCLRGLLGLRQAQQM